MNITSCPFNLYKVGYIVVFFFLLLPHQNLRKRQKSLRKGNRLRRQLLMIQQLTMNSRSGKSTQHSSYPIFSCSSWNRKSRSRNIRSNLTSAYKSPLTALLIDNRSPLLILESTFHHSAVIGHLVLKICKPLSILFVFRNNVFLEDLFSVCSPRKKNERIFFF